MSNRADGRTANYSVYIEALPCDQYDNERGQISIYIGSGPPETLEWTVDYGDGAVFHNPAFESCTEHTPATWMTSGSHDVNKPHVYAQAGTYTVSVQIVVHPCDPTPGAVWPGLNPAPPEAVTLTLPVQRVAGPRPYPAPEISLIEP